MSLIEPFSAATAAPAPPRPRKRREAPFGLRLTAAQRDRLTAEAAGAPLGSYIKAKVLGDAVPVRMRRSGLPVEDRKALAQVLAALGASRIASNLNQLAKLAHLGALPVSPEIEAELAEGVHHVRDIRRLLIAALGLKPEAAP